ncbi:MAG: thermonuclease family protein [Pyrinomonadaceae bacterium]
MKLATRALLILITAILLGSHAHAQATLSGRVTSVVDGRTFMFESAHGRVTGRIQYIDVPEPEQPLNRVVREHFHKLAAGKDATFITSGFSPAALIGTLYIDGVDMGQQLVRDGAAWHVPPERTGQNPEESSIYEGHQAMARLERRGVWSIINLTPSWEFRQLKERDFQETAFVQAAQRTADGKAARNYPISKESEDMWVEVGGEPLSQRNPTGNLFWGYDAEKKIRNVSTPSIAQVLVNGNRPLEVELRIIYFQGELKPRTSNTVYVLALLATSPTHSFAGSDSLRIGADGKDIQVGSGQRFWRENGISVQELVQYKISRSDLKKMAAAKTLRITAAGFSGNGSDGFRRAIGQLLETVK